MDLSEPTATTVTAAELPPLPHFDPPILCGALTAALLGPTGWRCFCSMCGFVLCRIEGRSFAAEGQPLRRYRICRAGVAAGGHQSDRSGKGARPSYGPGWHPVEANSISWWILPCRPHVHCLGAGILFCVPANPLLPAIFQPLLAGAPGRRHSPRARELLCRIFQAFYIRQASGVLLLWGLGLHHAGTCSAEYLSDGRPQVFVTGHDTQVPKKV